MQAAADAPTALRTPAGRASVSRARLQVVAAAVLFSTGGAAIKGTSLTGLSGGLEVASLRSAVAAVALWLMIPAARRGWDRRVLGVGVAYAATLVLFVAANTTTTSANAIFLQSAAPLYVLAGGALLLHERVRRVDLAYMVVLMGGLALVLAGPVAAAPTAPRPALGNALAVGAGLCWAATVLGLRWLARGPRGAGDPAAAASVAGNLIAFLVCLPLALPLTASGRDWALIAYLGVVQVALAYVVLLAGMRLLAAFEVSLLLLVEPALNPVWSWLAHDEAPGALALAGGALILASTGVRLLAGRWAERRAGRGP